MKITENISILDSQTKNYPSNLSANIATAFLGMNIVNESKQRLKYPLRKVNLTMNQWLVLEMLFSKRAETASRVADIMSTDGASITRNVDELELRNLIKRNRLTNDRRVIQIELTVKGLQVTEKLFAAYAGLLDNFENRLTHNERVMWRKVERCIASHINKT